LTRRQLGLSAFAATVSHAAQSRDGQKPVTVIDQNPIRRRGTGLRAFDRSLACPRRNRNPCSRGSGLLQNAYVLAASGDRSSPPIPHHINDLTRHSLCWRWSKMLHIMLRRCSRRSRRASSNSKSGTGAEAVRIPRRRPKCRALDERCRGAVRVHTLTGFRFVNPDQALSFSGQTFRNQQAVNDSLALAAGGPVKPSERLWQPYRQSRKPAPSGGILEHFAPCRAMSMMS
jgi:hypothetical protein